MTPSHLQLDLTTAERQNLMQLSLPVSLSSLTLSGWIFSGYLILFCPTQQVCVCVCVLPVSFVRTQNTSVLVVAPYLMPNSTSGIYHKVDNYLWVKEWTNPLIQLPMEHFHQECSQPPQN